LQIEIPYYEINTLISPQETIKKKEQNKPKASGRKEIMKMKTKVNKIENGKK
jgi:hypothetical protein